MGYYDNTELYQSKGIDYDLGACLEYNPQETFTIEDIKKVLVVFEGEKGKRDWRWILQLDDGRFVYLQGGCDYTGWDCRSSANHEFCTTALEAAKHKDFYSYSYHKQEEQQEVNISLISQVTGNKNLTWRERMDKSFPDVPKIKL